MRRSKTMSEININELTAEQIKQFNPTLYEKIRNDVDPNAEIETLKDIMLIIFKEKEIYLRQIL